MDLFRRMLLYDQADGEVVHNCLMQGALRPWSVEQEAAYFGLTNYGAFFWTEPDPEVEAAFAPVDAEGKPRSVHVSVDVSGETPELVFSYEPVPQAEPGETEDMTAALALLGVTPKETEE